MRRNTLSYWTRHTFPIVRHVHLQDVMIPSGNLLFKATKTKSRELTDRGSQLLTNALHDYRAERIMENLHWLLLVVVVEEECKKVIKTRFYVYRSLLEDFCTENVITSAKIKWECWEKNPGGNFLQIQQFYVLCRWKDPMVWTVHTLWGFCVYVVPQVTTVTVSALSRRSGIQ